MEYELLDYDKQREQDYINGGASRCPICGSLSVRADGRVEVEDEVGTCYVTCNTCDGKWIEVWHLVGICNIYKKVGVAET